MPVFTVTHRAQMVILDHRELKAPEEKLLVTIT